MDMVKYIIQIFSHYLSIVWSWGFNTPVAIPNGLRFKVQGFIHKGWGEVVYDEGSDTFTIRTLNPNGTVKKEVNDVYLDSLVEVIDGMVERCPNYKERVQEQYGLISK